MKKPILKWTAIFILYLVMLGFILPILVSAPSDISVLIGVLIILALISGLLKMIPFSSFKKFLNNLNSKQFKN